MSDILLRLIQFVALYLFISAIFGFLVWLVFIYACKGQEKHKRIYRGLNSPIGAIYIFLYVGLKWPFIIGRFLYALITDKPCVIAEIPTVEMED